MISFNLLDRRSFSLLKTNCYHSFHISSLQVKERLTLFWRWAVLSLVDAQGPRVASGLICSQSVTVQWRVLASFTRSQPLFTSRGICRAQSLPPTVLIRCVQSFRSATFPAWLFKASSFFLHLFDYRFHRALAAGTAATRMQTSVSAESVAWRRRPQVGIGTCAAAPWWPTWLTVTTVTILTCNKLTYVT